MANREDKVPEGWSYSGEVWTDADGSAVVALPAFVRLHRDGFDYELTPIGPGGAARVAEEVHDDRFTIETDEPHTKVAWRITPLREAASGGGNA
jgi:hypothetical protein